MYPLLHSGKYPRGNVDWANNEVKQLKGKKKWPLYTHTSNLET